MGYVLLWIEVYACVVLATALLVALASRVRRRGWRIVAAGAAALGPTLLVVGVPLLAVTAMAFQMYGPDRWRYVGPLSAMLIAALGAAAALTFKLLRRDRRAAVDDEGDTRDEPRTVGASWPAGKLLAALAAAVVITLMTLWNLDLAVRSQMAVARVEAGAMALSLAPPQAPDAVNAARLYERAFAALPEQFDADLPPERVAELLASHHATIEVLHEATAMHDVSFDKDWARPSFDMLLPEVGHMRNAARLLKHAARHAAEHGDVDSAVRHVAAMLNLAEHVQREPMLITLLVAAAIDTEAAAALEHALQHGAPSGAAVRALADTRRFDYHRSLVRALRMEHAFGIATFAQLGAGDIEYDLVSLFGEDPGGIDVLATLPYRVFHLSTDAAAYNRVMSTYERLATEPWWELTDERRTETERLARGGLLTAFIAPALSAAFDVVTEAEARRRLIDLTTMLLVDHAERGAWVTSADEAAARLPAPVPTDPFDGKPLRITRDGDTLRLHSIGRDGDDDGGATRWTHEADDGDVVIGLPLTR